MLAFLEKYDSLVDFVRGNFNGGLPAGFDSHWVYGSAAH